MRMSGLSKVEIPVSWVGGGPMEAERIALNQRERERLKVTVRQVRRLLLALAERGDGAMVHGLRGRASNPPTSNWR